MDLYLRESISLVAFSLSEKPNETALTRSAIQEN